MNAIENFLRQLLSLLPPQLQTPAVYLVCLGLGLFALAFMLFLVIRILRIRWQPDTIHLIQLENKSNLPGIFKISAQAPSKDLKFEYWLEGARLAVKPAPPRPLPARAFAPETAQRQAQPQGVASGSLQAAPQLAPAAASGTASPAAAPGSPQKQGPGAKEELAKAGKKAQDTSKKALGMGRMVGSILGTLGSILPGSVGQSFKEASTNVQGQMQATGSAIDQPAQKMRSVESLKGQAGNLKSAAGGPKSPPAGLPGQPPAKPAAAPAAGAGSAIGQPTRPISHPSQAAEAQEKSALTASTPQAGLADQRPQAVLQIEKDLPALGEFIQTNPLLPGEKLALELHIRPRSAYRSSQITYWVVSQQEIPTHQVDALLAAMPALAFQQPQVFGARSHNGAQAAVTTITTQKTVFTFVTEGISQVYRLTTILLVALAVELNILWVLPVIRWLLKLVG